MGQKIAKLILEAVTSWILLAQKLVAGMIGHNGNITAKIVYGLGVWLGPQFPQPADKLHRNVAGQVSCLIIG